MLNIRENNNGMKKHQFLLILLAIISKQTLNIEFDASYKKPLTRVIVISNHIVLSGYKPTSLLRYSNERWSNKKESDTYVNVHKNWQIIKFILISVIINNYQSNPLLFYWRDIYFWVFPRCDTCDVSGSFHGEIIQVMNTYFIWYFDKKCTRL